MFYIDFGVLLITEINFPDDYAYNARAVKSPDLIKMTELEPEWQLVNRNTPLDDSDWMKEEEWLLEFAENPVFEKQPLDKIAMTFLYVDSGSSIVAITKSTICLDVGEKSSRLNEPAFSDKVKAAKTPKRIFTEDGDATWLDKTYLFESASLYSVPVSHETMGHYEPARELSPLKNTAKILGSLIIFHDLYEIVIVMREEKTELKSIMKTGDIRPSSAALTKKVRFPLVLTNGKNARREKRRTKKAR
jgi:hypothetical protein